MTTTYPVAQLHIAREGNKAEAVLDGALLRQTGSLATLINGRRETVSASLNHSELMRLVKSRQSLLAAARDCAVSGAGRKLPCFRDAA